jgi:hypothetical protein
MVRGYLSSRQSAERENSLGTHEDAKIAARSMINSWLKQQRIRAEKG